MYETMCNGTLRSLVTCRHKLHEREIFGSVGFRGWPHLALDR
jgi:hypothetical protein